MKTRLSMSVMQNVFAACCFSLNIHIFILQYKWTFVLYICSDNSDYFSLSGHFISTDDFSFGDAAISA